MRLRTTLQFALTLTAIVASCSALAASCEIHWMVVGDKVLELVDDRQLTFKADGGVRLALVSPDGKCVAFVKQADDSFSINIASTRGTSVKSLAIAVDPPAKPLEKSWVPGRWWMAGPVAWSPDSRLLAVLATYRAPCPESESEEASVENHLLFIQSDGKLKKSCLLQRKIPDEQVSSCLMAFSPDSSKLALSSDGAYFDSTINELSSGMWLRIIDPSSGATLLASRAKDIIRPDMLSWTKNGSSLLLGDCFNLVSVSAKDGAQQKLHESQDGVVYSSDGRYCLLRKTREGDPGIRLRERQGDSIVWIAKAVDASFVHWYPNGNLLTYKLPQTIKDDSGKRTRPLWSLWLASVLGGEHAMCVALDADEDSASFSHDYTRMAYLLNGRVHVAELGWRAPTMGEKLNAGLKLTEEEEKQALTKQGEQAAVALEQCMMDMKSGLPGSMADLQPFAGAKTFLRPGSDQMIFKFLLPEDPWKTDSGGKRYIPGDTIVGEYDSGYSWKVVVYIDGRAEAVQK